MPKKIKAKKKAKKAASRKPIKKAVKKKTLKKKSTPAKKSIKKKTLKKKTLKKKTLSVRKKTVTMEPIFVEPGPPPRVIPPVEEPIASEEAIGTVTHYYNHLNVAIVQINKGTLKVGDTVHLKGHTTDFSQIVESMEYEHMHIVQADVGQSVGIKVKDQAREHDIVYLVK
jgi:translation elongation factor EF-Tu-like GTPase